MLRIKRVYEPAAHGDGYRVLVDRLWPRGLRKAELALDAWARELAPSSDLRKRFGHRPEGWDEFRRLYLVELRAPAAQRALEELASRAAHGTVTLLFAARDLKRNNAAVLLEELSRRSAAGHAHP